ncbi:MAG: class III extradiol dioxygenase subunit B-like domain-containing protein [Candidatus Falkowbacteria bacterium]|nr:class III extradiol dioxygenase subunit B-like domain-containing protein [Candidatus Falkowbacteria bacterium]
MALVFAAVMPHSPLLVPNIGKEHTAQFKATIDAGAGLLKELEANKVDSVIVISSKGQVFPNGISINIAPNFKANLEIFGDLVTRWDFNGDIALAGRLRENLEEKHNIMLTTETGLDYGTAIPLYLLSNNFRESIVPLTVDNAIGIEEIIKTGKDMQATIINDQSRIAIIASADLSHRLNKKSPTGYSAKGKKFDQKIIEALKEKDEATLIELSAISEEVACEDLATLALFVGLLNDVGLEPRLLSYEFPFGVGHAMIQYSQSGDLSPKS